MCNLFSIIQFKAKTRVGLYRREQLKETLIISAYTCCGKTYASEHIKDYKILDVNFEQFNYIERLPNEEEIEEERKWWKSILRLTPVEEHLNKFKSTSIRVIDSGFMNNYIRYIKENIGKVDVIFVGSDINIRKALDAANIKFVTVYPRIDCLCEYVGRMYLNHYDKKFIDEQISKWKNMKYIYEPWGDCVIRFTRDQYIDVLFIDACFQARFGVNKIESNSK